jgi:hypothetical protein
MYEPWSLLESIEQDEEERKKRRREDRRCGAIASTRSVFSLLRPSTGRISLIDPNVLTVAAAKVATPAVILSRRRETRL